MRAALLCLLLTGCAGIEHRFTAECAFGAERADNAYACAVQNFGEEGAREIAERQLACAVFCKDAPVHGAEGWCAISCEPAEPVL